MANVFMARNGAVVGSHQTNPIFKEALVVTPRSYLPIEGSQKKYRRRIGERSKPVFIVYVRSDINSNSIGRPSSEEH